MESESKSSAGRTAIDEQVVRTLAQIEGLAFPSDRLPAIAQRLRDMHEMASELDRADLTGAEPAIWFDPTWANGGAA